MIPQLFRKCHHVEILGLAVSSIESIKKIFESNEYFILGQWEKLISKTLKVLCKHVAFRDIDWNREGVFFFVLINQLLLQVLKDFLDLLLSIFLARGVDASRFDLIILNDRVDGDRHILSVLRKSLE